MDDHKNSESEPSTKASSSAGSNRRNEYAFVHGFIDKRTGVRYLSTAQQTDDVNPKIESVEKFTRETQLCETRNHYCNTTRETWTQMDRSGIVLDSSHDYAFKPGPYEDSIAWEEKRNNAAMIIQKYARRRNARCKAKKLRKHVQDNLELTAELERKQKLEEEIHLRKEIHTHKHPRTKRDFEVLYQEVEAWQDEELHSIKGKGLLFEEQKLALQELLKKEVEFLQAIGKMKSVAAKENKEKRIKMMMCKMSAPKKWEFSGGRVVHVQTPSTLRASDLLRLYTALAKCARTIDERMCVLGYIKWTVQEYDCQLTKELIQLIEREADLMYRNRPVASLLGLRQRILDLFLKFIKVPKFNPEAAAYQCVPVDFDNASIQTMRRQSVPVCLHN